MPWKSRWQIDIPVTSLSSYLFTSPTAPLSDKPILIDAEKPEYHLTHHSYREWSKRFAAGLLQAGFQPGDRLLLYSGNSVFFPVVIQGTVMAGGIFTGANPGYVARELAYQLQDSGAKFLITAEGSLPTALEAIATANFPHDHLFVMGSGFEVFDNTAKPIQGIRHWSSLLASPSVGAAYTWQPFTSRDQMNRTAVINYSSGTTGVPKGVEITHLNYVANCMQTAHMAALDPDYEAYLSRAVGLSFLPMYHAYGQTYHGVSTVMKGIPVYLMRQFDFVSMLEYIQRYRVTSLTLVPPIAVALTKRPEVATYDLSSVEAAGCGAAPLSAETIRDFESLFGNRFQLKQGWGMTEITCSACGWDPEVDSDARMVGELNPNIEGMMVDEEGREVVGEGQRGEFWVRGPNVMKGYWRKPEATRDTIAEGGWLKTGDIAVRGPGGVLGIVDRKKELIKVKGNQVAPAELEGLLLDHPAIQDAAVVGVTISGEELPRAYIVLQAGQGGKVQPKDVADWLAGRVARHKRLAGGVVFVDAIPKNPSGKILRKALRERARGEVGDREVRDGSSRL